MNKWNEMTVDERADIRDGLYDAQEKMNEAIELIRQYVDAAGDENARAYLLDHLKIMTNSGHGYLSRDLNLDTVINRCENWLHTGSTDEDDYDDEDDF